MLLPVGRLLRRPSLWVSLLTLLAYWDETALNGSFVYDDGGSVSKNVVVNGQVPLSEVLRRDYWGTPMSEPQSHKSFRPITTLTFRLNWLWEERQSGEKDRDDSSASSGKKAQVDTTYSFHIVNLLLHCVVTALVTDAAAFVFTGRMSELDVTAQLITGLIFGLHPVHVEAVTNITSRGELLMSFFFLSAFLVYANHIPLAPQQDNKFSIRTTICIFFIPWICMVLSVFSKEQGATTLMSLVFYDFVQNHSSVQDYVLKLRKKDAGAIPFLRRTVILALQTLVVVGWRYWLNGETTPDFIFDQNPAGFSEDRFTRVFSVSWVYCLYIRDAFYPFHLGPDWSGLSIDLIEDWGDKRILGVLSLWTFAAICLYSLFVGLSMAKASATLKMSEFRRVGLLAFFAFLFIPFLLSSNLLVVVGLMKADRVIYLPLLGFSMLEALLFKTLFGTAFPSSGSTSLLRELLTVRRRYMFGLFLVLSQLLFFSAKLHERNLAWSGPLNLWLPAYQINNRSRHTIYNAGYELSLKKRYAEAEKVLRPIGNPRVEGPSNTFVYAMVLFNLNRCDEARPLIDEAMVVVEEKRKTGGPRNTESSLARTKSNLMVAQAFCAPDMTQSAQLLYESVKVDPSNQYAIDQAVNMVKRLEATGQLNQ